MMKRMMFVLGAVLAVAGPALAQPPDAGMPVHPETLHSEPGAAAASGGEFWSAADTMLGWVHRMSADKGLPHSVRVITISDDCSVRIERPSAASKRGR